MVGIPSRKKPVSQRVKPIKAQESFPSPASSSALVNSVHFGVVGLVIAKGSVIYFQIQSELSRFKKEEKGKRKQNMQRHVLRGSLEENAVQDTLVGLKLPKVPNRGLLGWSFGGNTTKSPHRCTTGYIAEYLQNHSFRIGACAQASINYRI